MRSPYLKERASETTHMVAKKQLARRVRDQWPPAASDVSADARASLFTAFPADRLTGSRTEWFNQNMTCSRGPCQHHWSSLKNSQPSGFTGGMILSKYSLSQDIKFFGAVSLHFDWCFVMRFTALKR
tara:strand:- start:9743 stop:10123 length:381 start_codon:yes stop_codon:yes gene_type:complete